MLPEKLRAALNKAIGPESLDAIRRLFLDDGRRHWKGYAIAFVFMGLVAGTTAGLAYLMGDVINRIFVEQNSGAIWLLSGAVIALSVIKGLAGYGQAVVLGAIGNRIVADNQKRVIDQLLRQDVSYFAQRHTAEISLRINQGAQAARNVLNLVITSLGRDLFSVIGLAAVMIIQDAGMAMVGLIAMPIAVAGVRGLIRKVKRVFKKQYSDAAQIMSGSVEAFQGIRTVKSFNMEDALRATHLRQDRRAGEGVEPHGARAVAIRPDDGGARRRRHRRRHHVCGLRRAAYGAHAGRVLLRHHRPAALLRAGQAPGPAQYRPRHQPARRAHAVRGAGFGAGRTGKRQPAGASRSTRAASSSRTWCSAIARASRCCAASASSPSRARPRRWSARPAAARPR